MPEEMVTTMLIYEVLFQRFIDFYKTELLVVL